MNHEGPPKLMRRFRHCYYHDIYGIRHVERELRNTVVELLLRSTAIRGAVNRFLTDLEHVVNDVFDRLVKQAAANQYNWGTG